MNLAEAATQIDRLGERARDDFEAAGDFIWKIPTFVEQQRELELVKLFAYFPDDEESRQIRWLHESSKLDSSFPFFIATGHLFSLISLLESYLLQLCQLVEVLSAISLHSVSGQGVARLLKHLRSFGVEPSGARFWQQVEAALKIRHCFMHASGFLPFSREDAVLRLIAANRTYLSTAHRAVRGGPLEGRPEVAIVPTALGDRIQINSHYVFVLCAYTRDFFLAICDSVVSEGQRAEALRNSVLDIAGGKA